MLDKQLMQAFKQKLSKKKESKSVEDEKRVQERKRKALIEQMKRDMKVNDEDIEKELLERMKKEDQEEMEDDPFQSIFFNIL